MTDLFDLDGRVALVTGASSGLGLRFARVLADHGSRVAVVARRADRLEALADELGRDRCLPLVADVGDEAGVRAAVAKAVEAFGRLDVCVANAGVSAVGPAEDETTETFRRVVEVNLTGLFTTDREAARVMLAQGSGSIVNVASALGLKGLGRVPQAGYTASKGGVVNLTRELAAQWARRGVRVNGIAPGWFPSEMTDPALGDDGFQRFIRRTVPMGRAGAEDELDGVLLLLASDASRYMTGQTLAVDGGWTAV